MATDTDTRHESALQDRLSAAVGGVDNFASNWSWRSHSPRQRAESALIEGAQTIGAGVDGLTEKGATTEQVEEWTEKAIRLWLAYQAAGARTANPMITGPANFPVARNEKANAAERKRGDEFYLFAHRPVAWLSARERSAERAGCRVVKVAPRYTSQTCPECGTVEPKLLSQRVHRCDCGYEADRDVAAARVILLRAMQSPTEGNVGGYAVRSPGKAAA